MTMLFLIYIWIYFNFFFRCWFHRWRGRGWLLIIESCSYFLCFFFSCSFVTSFFCFFPFLNFSVCASVCLSFFHSVSVYSTRQNYGKKKRFNLQAPPVYDRKVTNLFFSINIVSIICFFHNSVGDCMSIDSQFECILRSSKKGILNYRKYVSKDLVYAPKSSIDVHNIMWCSQFECILRGKIEL